MKVQIVKTLNAFEVRVNGTCVDVYTEGGCYWQVATDGSLFRGNVTGVSEDGQSFITDYASDGKLDPRDMHSDYSTALESQILFYERKSDELNAALKANAEKLLKLSAHRNVVRALRSFSPHVVMVTRKNHSNSSRGSIGLVTSRLGRRLSHLVALLLPEQEDSRSNIVLPSCSVEEVKSKLPDVEVINLDDYPEIWSIDE